MFSKALVVSALASIAFASECTRTYTVKAGDICDSISSAQNVSTYQLSTVNADKINDACTNLEVGQVLCLATKGQDCSTVHNVAAGDTCGGIMKAYNINDTVLYANNPQIDDNCSNIYIGEVLCAANGFFAPNAVPGRMVGAAGGSPAGPPAPAPYPAAKMRKEKAPAPAPEPAPKPSPEPAPKPAPKPAPAAPPTPDNDDDLPECEDPNDDGEW